MISQVWKRHLNEISAIFSDTHRKNTELLDYINEYLKVL